MMITARAVLGIAGTEQRVSDDAYHRGYVDVPSERVWDLPHIKRAIAWASFERECDEKRPDGSVHLHGRYRRGAYVEPTCRRLGVRLVETT
jgi:hypothetical protein